MRNLFFQTWTVIELERNSILIDNLLANTMYRVCIKCRQAYNDPQGLEECQEIKTLKDSRFFLFNDSIIEFSSRYYFLDYCYYYSNHCIISS